MWYTSFIASQFFFPFCCERFLNFEFMLQTLQLQNKMICLFNQHLYGVYCVDITPSILQHERIEHKVVLKVNVIIPVL